LIIIWLTYPRKAGINIEVISVKKRIGIIGLGHVSEKYYYGLSHNTDFILVSVCDINLSASNLFIYRDFPFYTDYLEMIQHENLDFVLIATPPKTHYEIASNCLNHLCNVLLEKPGSMNIIEIIHLMDIAKRSGIRFEIIYHWCYANEIQYFYQNRNLFGDIQSIKIHINDPYLNNKGVIDPQFYSLEGCWIDSSINVFSMLHQVIPLEQIELIQQKYQFDQSSGLPFSCYMVFKHELILIVIDIRWTQKKNFKLTEIKTNTGLYRINHSLQRITHNDVLLYQGNQFDRLSTHYLNYFNQVLKSNTIDLRTNLLIHELAFNYNRVRKVKYDGNK